MRRILLLIIIFTNTKIYSQIAVENSLVKWYTLEQVELLTKKQPRPVLMDVYTDWCGWCKVMMSNTFSNKGIADYINNNFYPVRFNAETTDSVRYKDTLYRNKGKTHDLAVKLLNGQLSYPTIVYFDRKGNRFPVPGYYKANEIEPFLVYFAEDLNSSVAFEEFHKNYLFSFPTVYKEEISKMDNMQKPDTSGVVNWLTFEKAESLVKTMPKPFFLDVYVDWCISCKVMEKTTYKNKIIANYLNTNFYPIRFNAASKDSIRFLNKTFYGATINSPHQLAAALLQGNFKFPATIELNSDFQILNRMSEYLVPGIFEAVLKYFGEGIYKNKRFDEYYKGFKGEIRK